MKEEPLGDALLEEAHQLLKDELIPALPAEKRHAAMMVASAIAIAMRQGRAGQLQELQEADVLERLLEGKPAIAPEAPADPRVRLQALQQQLCRRIARAAPGAPELGPAMHAHLLRFTTETLLESSPKYLR